LSDSDGRSGRLVRQVAQILEGTRVAMERMRVAKDGTNRPVVIRVSISLVSEALLVSVPRSCRWTPLPSEACRQ